MRGRKKLIAALLLAIIIALLLAITWHRRGQQTLTVAPVRHMPEGERREKLIIAVTNNRSCGVVGYIGQGTNLARESQFRLAPHCGTLVEIHGPRRGPWMVGGGYVRDVSKGEINVRRYLSKHTPLGWKALTILDGLEEKPIKWVRVDQ